MRDEEADLRLCEAELVQCEKADADGYPAGDHYVVSLVAQRHYILALRSERERAEKAEDRVRELEKAIGVMVPTIIRCYLQMDISDVDREYAGKTLNRIQNAMAYAPLPSPSTPDSKEEK
jgi:hypothetical protein